LYVRSQLYSACILNLLRSFRLTLYQCITCQIPIVPLGFEPAIRRQRYDSCPCQPPTMSMEASDDGKLHEVFDKVSVFCIKHEEVSTFVSTSSATCVIRVNDGGLTDLSRNSCFIVRNDRLRSALFLYPLQTARTPKPVLRPGSLDAAQNAKMGQCSEEAQNQSDEQGEAGSQEQMRISWSVQHLTAGQFTLSWDISRRIATRITRTGIAMQWYLGEERPPARG
jgi:hypothetical protein